MYERESVVIDGRTEREKFGKRLSRYFTLRPGGKSLDLVNKQLASKLLPEDRNYLCIQLYGEEMERSEVFRWNPAKSQHAKIIDVFRKYSSDPRPVFQVFSLRLLLDTSRCKVYRLLVGDHAEDIVISISNTLQSMSEWENPKGVKSCLFCLLCDRPLLDADGKECLCTTKDKTWKYFFGDELGAQIGNAWSCLPSVPTMPASIGMWKNDAWLEPGEE